MNRFLFGVLFVLVHFGFASWASYYVMSLCACMLSHFSHCLDCGLWTVAHHAPMSMGFSNQDYWSGLPCLLQGIFSTQGSNRHLLRLLHGQVGSLPQAPPGKPMRLWVLFTSFIRQLPCLGLAGRRWPPFVGVVGSNANFVFRGFVVLLSSAWFVRRCWSALIHGSAA